MRRSKFVTFTFHRCIEKFFYGRLAYASAWMLTGSLVAGVLGYALQVLMGRMLSVQEYALFCAIMALFTILATPLNTMMLLISRRISEYRANIDNAKINYLFYAIHRRTILVVLLILSICFPFSSYIQQYLKAPSTLSVYLLGMLLFATCLPFINNAFLQGLQKFNWLSTSNVLNAIFKICLCVALVRIGYGVPGVVGGMGLAYLLTWLITFVVLHNSFKKVQIQAQRNYASVTLSSILPVFAANVTFAVITQLDILLVNYFYSAKEAGFYAAAAILGKAVLYLPGGITLALFPMVAQNHVSREGSAHLLVQALGLTSLLCLIGASIYFFCGNWLVELIYGYKYYEAGNLLRYYGFAILPMCLVMVIEYFLIAKGRVLFAYLILAIAPLQILAVYYFHDSLISIIAINATFGVLTVIIGLAFLWRNFITRSG